MILSICIFFVSFSLLAYQILLMRIFSITSWSNFAYMMISLALLGFGASGSFLHFLHKKINQNFNLFFLIFSFSFGIALFITVWAVQLVPLSPLLIPWYKIQYLYLFISYLILFVPFFLGATCIGMSFIHMGRKIPNLYFFNMVGSGTGTLGVIFLMFLFFPADILFFLSILGLFTGLLFSIKLGKKYLRFTIFLFSFITCLFYLHPLTLKISEYKGLSKSLNLPQARILKEYFSPFGFIDILESPAIRYAPGLSFNFQKETPPQLALFVDADSMSVINHFQGNLSKIEYLDYLTSSLPYHLLKNPEVLVIGAGGGSEILSALYHKASKIEAVEVNPQIIKIVGKDYANFAGKIYSLPEVKVILAEGRGYTESTSNRYDLIQISLLDSFAASSAGVYALSESYLYTVEAMACFLRRLNSQGILCITRWIKTPPRDGIRVLSTLVAAMEKLNFPQPSKHIVMIRSWSTSTILAKKSPFSSKEIEKIIEFTQARSFDICWYPGIRKDEVNKFHILPQPYFYQAARRIFSPEREKFYENYLFDVTPTTDDSPYFFHFFKIKSLPFLIKNLGKQWIPFVEWGYIILLATLIQAVVGACIFILIPLLAFDRRKSSSKKQVSHVFFYFLSLGIAYMFLEISFIQRFILFLHYPVYTVAVVITGFLTFSGLGSAFSSRFLQKERSGINLSFLGILVFSVCYIIFLRNLFLFLINLNDWLKIVTSLGLIFPLAFFMGMMFPLGLSRVSNRHPQLVPWAWGINGCASVVSSILATFIAISLGFRLVGILALLFYTLAYFTYPD